MKTNQKIYLIPILLFSVLNMLSQIPWDHSKDNYRVVMFDNVKFTSNFTLPPYSNINFYKNQECIDKNKSVIKKDYRFHYFIFKNLKKAGNNYFEFCKQIDRVFYDYTSKSLISQCDSGSSFRVKKQEFIVQNDYSDTNNYCVAISKNGDLFVEINYQAIFNSLTKTKAENSKALKDQFFTLAMDLFLEIGEIEVLKTRKEEWPESVSQTFVEKIFERIPIPQQATLSRYICKTDEESAFILLNPKIKVQVDLTDLVKPATSWNFNLLGSALITITRDASGRIIQTPFLNIQKSGLFPTNNIDATKKKILLASTGDVQLSNTLRTCPYVFLFQKSFKYNNSGSDVGNTNCTGSEKNLVECNSQFLHFKAIASDMFPDINIDPEKADYRSAFGNRNLMTPCIEVFINNKPEILPLGTTFDQLQLQYTVQKSMKIYRFFSGYYYRMNINKITDILLLPGDKIQ